MLARLLPPAGTAALLSLTLIACGRELETNEEFAIAADATGDDVNNDDVNNDDVNNDTANGVPFAINQGVMARGPGRVSIDEDGAVRLRDSRLPTDIVVITRSIDGETVAELPAQHDAVDERWIDRNGALERIVEVEEGIWQSWLFMDRPAPHGDDADANEQSDLVVRVEVPEGEWASSMAGAHLFLLGDQTFQFGRATWIDDTARRFDVVSTWDEASREVVMRVPAATLAETTWPATLDPVIGLELDVDTPFGGPIGFHETTPAVARSGTTWLAVWNDTRNGEADIYGTRINDAGQVLDPFGIKISTAANAQLEPKVAAANGGWIVVWTDQRADSVTGDIYGAFVTTAGVVNQPSGVSIAASAADEHAPAIVGDGSISPIIVWDAGGDIAGATMSPTGSVTSFPLIEGSTAVQGRPSVALEPGGVGLVAWDEAVALTGGVEVRARRINRTSGASLDGLPIIVSQGQGYRTSPRATWAGGRFVIVYDMQFGDLDVRASRVSTAGVDLDVVDVPLGALVARHIAPTVSCNGAQCIAAYQRGDGFEWNVVGVSFDASTMAVGGVTTISGHARKEQSVALASSGTGFFGVWQDDRGGDGADIFGARIGSGLAVQDGAGLLLSRGNNRMRRATGGSAADGFMAVWMDSNASSAGRLRGRRFDVNGVPAQGPGLFIGGNINNGVALFNTIGLVHAGGSIDSSVKACGTIVAAGSNAAINGGAECGANTPFNPVANGVVPAPTSPPLNWTTEDAFFYDWASPCNFFSRASGTNAGFFFWDPTANNGTCGSYAGALVPPSTDPSSTGGCWVPIFVNPTAPTPYAPYANASPAEVTTLTATSPTGCRSWEPQTATGSITDPSGTTSGTATNWYVGSAQRTKPDWSQCGGPTYPASRVQWGTTPPNPTPTGPDETCAGDCNGQNKALDWCPALLDGSGDPKHFDFNFESVDGRKAVPTGVYYVDGNFSHNDGNTLRCAPNDQTNPAPNGTVWPMATVIIKGNYTQPAGQAEMCFGVGTKKGQYASLVVGGGLVIGSAQSFVRTAGSLIVKGQVATKGMIAFGTIRVDGGFAQQSSATFTWRYTRDIANLVVGVGNEIDFSAFTVGGGGGGAATVPSISRRASNNGTFLVTWSDTRNDVFGDIYAARVNMTSGVRDGAGFPIAQTFGVQELAPAVASDGSGWLVAWQDRNAGFDIHGAIVRADGTIAASDIVISAATNDQLVPTVAWDPAANVYVVAWMDVRNGNPDIFAARVSSTGTVLDAAGVAVAAVAELQEHPDAIAGAGVVGVTWADQRSGSRDIYAARLRSSNGSLQVLDAGIPVSTNAAAERFPSIDSNGVDFAIVWTDERNVQSDIFGTLLLGDGTVVSPAGIALAALTDVNEAEPIFSALPTATGSLRGELYYTRREPTLETERVKARRVTFSP